VPEGRAGSEDISEFVREELHRLFPRELKGRHSTNLNAWIGDLGRGD
jgi:hypothetical protein